MGCDIHFFVERWTSSNDYLGPRDLEDDRDQKISEVLDAPVRHRWVSADKWQIEDGQWHIDWDDEYYNGRNYQLFSLLAGVRGDLDPIIQRRGIPEDASTGYLYKCNQWEGDAHSHTYYTLDELLNVDWSKYEDLYPEEFIKSIEIMKLIDSDPKKVRCCFFFDN